MPAGLRPQLLLLALALPHSRDPGRLLPAQVAKCESRLIRAVVAIIPKFLCLRETRDSKRRVRRCNSLSSNIRRLSRRTSQ